MSDPNFAGHVTDFKARVRIAVVDALSQLREATGVSPSDVRIRMMETTNCASYIRSYEILSIEVKFDL